MICEKCGSSLILYRENREKELKCPICNNLNILDEETALKIVKMQLDWFRNAFSVILKRFDKKRIAWLLREREKRTVSFFQDKPMIPLGEFLSINVLIKVITKVLDIEGNEKANEKNTLQLIETFSKFLNIVEIHERIKDGYAQLVVPDKYSLEDFTLEKMTLGEAKFYLVHNVAWIPIQESFESHLIVSKKDADQKLKELYEEYEKANKDKKQWDTNITTEKAIEELYPALLSLFCGLQKNVVYKRVFDFSHLKQAAIPPELVRVIANEKSSNLIG